jgi:hypothetical protein
VAVRQCGSVRGSARGSVRLSGFARSSMRLSSGVAAGSISAVSKFSNNSKHIQIHLYKSGINSEQFKISHVNIHIN